MTHCVPVIRRLHCPTLRKLRVLRASKECRTLQISYGAEKLTADRHDLTRRKIIIFPNYHHILLYMYMSPCVNMFHQKSSGYTKKLFSSYLYFYFLVIMSTPNFKSGFEVVKYNLIIFGLILLVL